MPDRSSHGSQLQHLRVRDCMHAGVLTCSADTPLVEVAGIMTKHRVHAVAVIDDKRRPIGVVSALDVVAAASRNEHERVTARVATAGTEPLITISTDAPLDRAAKLMTKHRVHHLIAVDPANGYPVGIPFVLPQVCVAGATRAAPPVRERLRDSGGTAAALVLATSERWPALGASGLAMKRSRASCSLSALSGNVISVLSRGCARGRRGRFHVRPVDGCGAEADDLDGVARLAQFDCLGLSPEQ